MMTVRLYPSGDFALSGLSDPCRLSDQIAGQDNNSQASMARRFFPRGKEWISTSQDLEVRLRRNCFNEDVAYRSPSKNSEIVCLRNEVEFEEGRILSGGETYWEVGLMSTDSDYNLPTCDEGRSQHVDGSSVDWSEEGDFRIEMEANFCERCENNCRSWKDGSSDLGNSDQGTDDVADPFLESILDFEKSSFEVDELPDFYKTVYISEEVDKRCDNDIQCMTECDFGRKHRDEVKREVDKLSRGDETVSLVQTTKAGDAVSLNCSKWKLSCLQKIGKVSSNCRSPPDWKSNSVDTSETSNSPADSDELVGAEEEDSLSGLEEKYFAAHSDQDLYSWNVWNQADNNEWIPHSDDRASHLSDTQSLCNLLTTGNAGAFESTFNRNAVLGHSRVEMSDSDGEQSCLEQSAMLEDDCVNLKTRGTETPACSSEKFSCQSSLTGDDAIADRVSDIGTFRTHCFLLKQATGQDRLMKHPRKLNLICCEAVKDSGTLSSSPMFCANTD